MNPLLLTAEVPTHEDFHQRRVEAQPKAYVEQREVWEKLPVPDRGVEPAIPAVPALSDTKDAYDSSLEHSGLSISRGTALSNRHLAVQDWIELTVDKTLLGVAQIQLTTEGDASLTSGSVQS